MACNFIPKLTQFLNHCDLFFQRGGGEAPLKMEITPAETIKKLETNGVANDSKKVVTSNSHSSKRKTEVSSSRESQRKEERKEEPRSKDRKDQRVRANTFE
jgi:hypothetical protein